MRVSKFFILTSFPAALLDFLQLRRRFMCKTVTILCVVAFIVLLTSLFLSLNGSTDHESEVALTIVRRDEWHGRAPNYSRTLPLELPATRAIIIHTATESCFDLETCSVRVRSIQNYHMDGINWADIGFNFLVGGDGRVYEGRGWQMEGVHTFS